MGASGLDGLIVEMDRVKVANQSFGVFVIRVPRIREDFKLRLEAGMPPLSSGGAGFSPAM